MSERFDLYAQVAASDVASGFPGSCSLCPVAVAVRRALDRGHVHYKVSVLSDRVYLEGRDATYRADLSESARDWIKRFDVGFHPMPIGLELSFRRVGPKPGRAAEATRD